MATRIRIAVILATLLVLVSLPTVAYAQDLPDAVEDPVAAFEAEAEAEAVPAPVVEPAPEAQAVALAVPETPNPAPIVSGTLPFTGVGSDGLMLASLLGALFTLAGVTALAAARAVRPAQT